MVPDGEAESMHSVLTTHWLEGGDSKVGYCVFHVPHRRNGVNTRQLSVSTGAALDIS